MLDAAEAAGAERVVHLSSVVVYGYEDERHQDEGAYRRAVGIPYIDTKSASDALAARRGAVIVRPGDVYGPGSVPWLVRPVELMASGQMALPNKGDGTMLPAYVDDLVAAIVLALRRGEPGPLLHRLGRPGVSFTDYYRLLAEAARPARAADAAEAAAVRRRRRARGRSEAARASRPPFGRHGVTFLDRRGTASNERAREELGWAPSVELPEGIRRSAEWIRAEGML